MGEKDLEKQSAAKSFGRRAFLQQSALAAAGAALTEVVTSPISMAKDLNDPFLTFGGGNNSRIAGSNGFRKADSTSADRDVH